MAVKRKEARRIKGEISCSADERRGSCRYPAVEDRGWLGWWEGQTFLNTSVRLLDISLRGAMMVVDAMPPSGESVYFCPPGITSPEWLEARLVECKKQAFGPREVRIAFRRPFPYETFKAVVFGHKKVRGSDVLPHAAHDRNARKKH